MADPAQDNRQKGGLDIAAQREKLKASFGGGLARMRGQAPEAPSPAMQTPQTHQERPSGRLLPALMQLVEIEAHDEALAILKRDETLQEGMSHQGLTSSFVSAGLQLKIEEIALEKLKSKTLPAVALTLGGRVIILLSYDGETLSFAENNILKTLPAKGLKEFGAAVIFSIARLEEAPQSAGLSRGASHVGMGENWPGFFKAAWTNMLANERPLLYQMGAAGVLSYFMMLALPMFTMAVYDRIIPHMAMETLWALGIGVFLALCLDLALRHVRQKLQDAAGLSMAQFLEGTLFRKIMRTRLQSAPEQPVQVQHSLKELESLAGLLPQVTVSVLIDIPVFILLLTFLAYLGGPIMLVPLLGVVAVAGLQAFYFEKSAKANAAVFLAGQKQLGFIHEVIEGLERNKALNATSFLSRQWERLMGDYAMKAHESRHMSALLSQTSLILTQMVILFVLIVGVYQVRDGAMSMGALIASILLVGRAVSPMTMCVSSLMRLMQMQKTIGWIDAMMAAPEESAARQAKVSPRPSFAFENVSLTYEGAHRPALHGLNLAITAGEKIAVIGRTGSGKSSLLRLLARLDEPSGGMIRLDGYNIVQYDPSVVRLMAGYCGQTPTRFDGTIWHNLTFGLSQVNEAAMERACRITGVAGFVASQPEGYGFKVGPRGERLSGGERQAIALARSLAVSPKLLLLDEPTAPFDTQGEQEFIAGLASMLEGRTLIIATHRLPILKLVDRVILLDKGQVVADGSRQEVIAKLTRAAGQ